MRGLLRNFWKFRSSHQRCSIKIAFLRNFTNLPENTWGLQLYYHLAQVVSIEFCETSKNTFCTEHLWTTASENYFLYCFVFQVISEKTLCSKDFTGNFKRDFYTKIVVTIISTNLFTSSLIPLVCPSTETKKKNQIFNKLVIW